MALNSLVSRDVCGNKDKAMQCLSLVRRELADAGVAGHKIKQDPTTPLTFFLFDKVGINSPCILYRQPLISIWLNRIYCPCLAMAATVILGTQFGDEGKGKLVDVLLESEDYSITARCNGNSSFSFSVLS